MRLILTALAVMFTATGSEVVFDRTIPSRTTGDTNVTIGGLRTGESLSVLIAAVRPAELPESGVIAGVPSVAEKILHPGDGDFYLRTVASGPNLAVRIQRPTRTPIRIRVVRLDQAEEFEPNDRWQDANPIELGSFVRASADDAAYLPITSGKLNREEGADWFRFEFRSAQTKLVYFQADLVDRDNIPVDVSIWRVVDGMAVEYTAGEDPVTLPHEVQALPGNKFTTRLLTDQGTYYIRVIARHPDYQLVTRVYDPPPYADPKQAVRVALDYLLGAGDSWHANTPRRGGIWDRVANVHQETSLCVACHPTHFTLRATLLAAANGYPVHQRRQVEFLAERFYNNPRPLYGFEGQGATWARVISAPANVLGRMSYLINLYEREITGERRESFHRGVAEYLKLYYQGRTKLPPDETNGNLPLVSAYEVAWYAWEVTRDPAIAALIEQDSGIKNLIDLCYQTQALAAIDRTKYAPKIEANARRILSLQRESGQWSMKFELSEKEVEFQTGHSLWALHAAGIPADHPQISRGLQYLLSRQQSFGGWLDPLQSFENFRTPFRETQMAVLALSAYYPAGELLKPERTKPIVKFDSPDTLELASELEKVGRAAPEQLLPEAIRLLGHPSKIVQRAAAFAVRQIYSRRDAPIAALESALASSDERTRWGATRVFATHFSALAQHPRLADALIRASTDSSPAVSVQALKGLWQFWFWTPSHEVKSRIEDAFLAGLRQPQHAWVETNLRQGIYNIADENIRYLYNNWVPSLARVEDRDRVVAGRLAIESRQAEKFTRFLVSTDNPARKRLLKALAEFPLRRADIYDPKADHESIVSPPVYNRIGNDVEQTVFFGESATRMSRAIAPLIHSSDPELKRLARDAALLVRDANFAAPVKLAGTTGPEVTELRAATQPPPKPKPAVVSGVKTAPTKRYGKPDEAYFRGYVQPILEARGKDGSACVHCHASHAIFDGTLGGALRVIDLDDPESSLILRKPTSSAEIEGTLEAQSGGKQLSHGGGVRWEKNSPEYNTILNWIKGATP